VASARWVRHDPTAVASVYGRPGIDHGALVNAALSAARIENLASVTASTSRVAARGTNVYA
jgi:hypothetical protein